MDVDSEASEGYEDFHPSSLLEVIVKEAESPTHDTKNDSDSTSSPRVVSPATLTQKGRESNPIYMPLYNDPSLPQHFLAQQSQKPSQNEDLLKKAETPKYWRICYLCNTKEAGGKDNPLAFHKFPAEVKLCKQWKRACNLDHKDDVANLKICSKHFKPDDYVDSRAKQLGGVLKLKQGAVPSIKIPNPVYSTPDGKKFILVACTPPRMSDSGTVVGSQLTALPNVSLKQLSGGVMLRKENQSPGSGEIVLRKVKQPLGSGEVVFRKDNQSAGSGGIVLRKDNQSAGSGGVMLQKVKQSPGNGELVLRKENQSPSSAGVILQKEKQSPGSGGVFLWKENQSPGDKNKVRQSLNLSTSLSEKSSSVSAVKAQQSDQTNKEKKDELSSYWRMCFLCDYKEPGGKNCKLAFHKFPADAKACKLWKQVCNVTDKDDVSTLKLCSKHFHPEDYFDSKAKELGGYLKLKPGTVPSIDVPNPLSKRNAPTKYFIVTNSCQTSLASVMSNGVQPSKLLNVIRQEPATSSPVKTGNVSGTALLVPAGGKMPNPSSVSASKLLLSNQPSVVLQCLDNAKQTKQSSSSPGTVKSKPAKPLPGTGNTKTTGLSSKTKPVLISSQNLIHIKQPRVVIHRLNMSTQKSLEKGQLSGKQLSKAMENIEKLEKAKSVSSSTVSSDSIVEETEKENGSSSSTEQKNDEDSEEDGETAKEKRSWRYCFLCGESNGKTVAFHHFPSDPHMCKLWKKACDLDTDGTVSAHLICSQHFKEEDFYEVRAKHMGNRLRIKIGAVPSVNVPRPVSPSEISETLAGLSENLDEFHPSNLLEVIVNESSPPASPNGKEDKKGGVILGGTRKTGRYCFLCDFKEEIGNHSSVALHKFPYEKHTNSLWKQVCNLYEHDYMNTSSLLICSNHFAANDYVDGTRRTGGLPMLKLGAVPSLSVPNPLKTMSLSTLASIEPENSENAEDINPSELMEVTLNVPDSPGLLHKEVKSEVTDDESEIIDVVDDDDPLACHSVQKPTSNILRTILNVENSQLLSSHTEVSEKTFSARKIENLDQISKPLAALNSVKTIPLSTIKSTDKVTPENAVSFSRQLLNTVNSIVHTQPELLGNLLHSGQTLKIVRNPQQPGNLSAQTIQIMPPLKFAVAPPGLFLPTQALKKSVNAIDQSSQTLVAVERTEQSCQTESTECSMDFADQDEKMEVASPPAAKKQRLSLPVIEPVVSESLQLKRAWKASTLKRLSHSQMLEQQMRRIKKRINCLEDLLCHLQKRDLLSKDAADTLVSIVSDGCREFIAKKLQAKGIGKWSQQLRNFVLTLHFYSIDAYNYVKNLWPTLVPDAAVLRSWFTVGNAKPGFTQEVLDAIYIRNRDSKENMLLNIMISEMQIQREIVFEDDRFYGGVDLGTYQDMQHDCMLEAQNALVFFVSDLSKSWSAPFGYFLINTLNAKERANLLTKCLDLLNEVCAKVLSITLNANPMNISMCTYLGANFSFGRGFQPWFLNPVTREKMFVFWDPCCMMKFVRDTLGDKRMLLDSENKSIKWSYIRELCKVQSELNWEMDLKLTEAHVDYQENRGDEKLCLQTLSRSVYKSFMKVLGTNIDSFEGCYSTAVYCLMFNNIFDVLNCRNEFSRKKYCVPITDESITSLHHSATVFIKYISGIKDDSGTPILNTCRKTGYLGLIVCLTNIFELFKTAQSFGLKQLLTHKISLDYVRTFFSAVLGPGDESSFLTAKEFENAYRNIVLKCGVNFESTDCLVDAVDVLRVNAQKEFYMDPICDYVDVMSVEWVDHEYFTAVFSLKPIFGNVMKYISGFVVNKILRKRLCPICAEHLTDEKNIEQLFKQRNQRKYIIPSVDVYRICSTAEIVFRENVQIVEQSDLQLLVTKIFSRVCFLVFGTEKMKVHTVEQGTFDNHMTQLCKLVIETFLDIRIFHENERMNSY